MANEDRGPASSDEERSSQRDSKTKTEKPGVTRRLFLGHIGAAGIVVTASPLLASAAQVETPAVIEAPSSVPGAVPVTLKINGQEYQLKLEPRVTLLDALRNNLQMFGTKKG